MDISTSLAFFIISVTSLFVIVNPFSTASVFLTITRDDSKEKKKLMAKKAVITAALVLIVFSLIGSYILNFFSITVEAFKIAGGLIIGAVGWKMINAKREILNSEEEEKAALDKDDVSIIPLAIPMLSGPGAITTSIVLAGEATGIFDIGALLIAILIVSILSYAILSHASIIDKFLGVPGRRVIDRIMGLIVLVVGVQFIINGTAGLITGWGII
jgi:multiple antibiotic resistance protein